MENSIVQNEETNKAADTRSPEHVTLRRYSAGAETVEMVIGELHTLMSNIVHGEVFPTEVAGMILDYRADRVDFRLCLAAGHVHASSDEDCLDDYTIANDELERMRAVYGWRPRGAFRKCKADGTHEWGEARS